MTIADVADVADDILTGPYDQALRDELRRQLDGLDVMLQLGQTLSGDSDKPQPRRALSLTESRPDEKTPVTTPARRPQTA